jgi:hypothetical protein
MYNVLNFSYDGIFVRPKAGLATYTAEFVKWTDDPGIAIFKCSDGKDRKLPACQIQDFDIKRHPEQILPQRRLDERKACGFIIGEPCHS